MEKFIFEGNYSLGEEISNYFGFNDIIIKKGEYELSFENNIFGDAYVNVLLIK